jgi:hypothetical protein
MSISPTNSPTNHSLALREQLFDEIKELQNEIVQDSEKALKFSIQSWDKVKQLTDSSSAREKSIFAKSLELSGVMIFTSQMRNRVMNEYRCELMTAYLENGGDLNTLAQIHSSNPPEQLAFKVQMLSLWKPHSPGC